MILLVNIVALMHGKLDLRLTRKQPLLCQFYYLILIHIFKGCLHASV